MRLIRKPLQPSKNARSYWATERLAGWQVLAWECHMVKGVALKVPQGASRAPPQSLS